MDESERYEQICKPFFDEIRQDAKDILRLLRGQNGNPGIVDDVRDLKSWRDEQRASRKGRVALITTIALMVLTNVFMVVRDWVTERDDGRADPSVRTTETRTDP